VNKKILFLKQILGYELFHNMTNPMITFTKKFDITNVIKQAKKGYKLNLIMYGGMLLLINNL